MTTKTQFDIPIAKPYFKGDEGELLGSILKQGWIVQGPMVEAFERAVCDYTGAKFAVATSSCTAALHLAMLVHDIGAADEVICPSYSFIATANAVCHAGAAPVFVDIDEATLNLNPDLVSEFIANTYDTTLKNKNTGRTLKAILAVHQIGLPADIDRLRAVADQLGIILIEDSACAIGSSYKTSRIGGSGNVNALSFHPRKVITTGEGGMILTDSLAIADRARVLRAHGASLSDYARHNSQVVVYESYEVVGFNYRMTDLQAALGLKQMELLEELVEKRIAIGAQFDCAFASLEPIEIVKINPYVTRWNYQSYPIRLRSGSQKQRDALIAFLKGRGVSTRRGIPPIHKEPAYACQTVLPKTEQVANTSLFLPIFPQLTQAEIVYIIESVRLGLNEIGLD